MFNDSKMTDFEKFAVGHRGINHLALNDFLNKSYNKFPMIQATMTPYIMEERQLNVAQVDVFSRLMMERIIWLFGPVEDFNTTVIQAQLMYLESVDSKKDISIHIDSPGGSVVADYICEKYDVDRSLFERDLDDFSVQLKEFSILE